MNWEMEEEDSDDVDAADNDPKAPIESDTHCTISESGNAWDK